MSFSPPFVIRLGIESCREHLGSSDTHALTEISQDGFCQVRCASSLPSRFTSNLGRLTGLAGDLETLPVDGNARLHSFHQS
jgi:hypothetical protein